MLLLPPAHVNRISLVCPLTCSAGKLGQGLACRQEQSSGVFGVLCKVWKGQNSWHRWPSAKADCCPSSWESCLMNMWCMDNMDVDRTDLLVGKGAEGRYQSRM